MLNKLRSPSFSSKQNRGKSGGQTENQLLNQTQDLNSSQLIKRGITKPVKHQNASNENAHQTMNMAAMNLHPHQMMQQHFDHTQQYHSAHQQHLAHYSQGLSSASTLPEQSQNHTQAQRKAMSQAKLKSNGSVKDHSQQPQQQLIFHHQQVHSKSNEKHGIMGSKYLKQKRVLDRTQVICSSDELNSSLNFIGQNTVNVMTAAHNQLSKKRQGKNQPYLNMSLQNPIQENTNTKFQQKAGDGSMFAINQKILQQQLHNQQTNSLGVQLQGQLQNMNIDQLLNQTLVQGAIGLGRGGLSTANQSHSGGSSSLNQRGQGGAGVKDLNHTQVLDMSKYLNPLSSGKSSGCDISSFSRPVKSGSLYSTSNQRNKSFQKQGIEDIEAENIQVSASNAHSLNATQQLYNLLSLSDNQNAQPVNVVNFMPYSTKSRDNTKQVRGNEPLQSGIQKFKISSSKSSNKNSFQQKQAASNQINDYTVNMANMTANIPKSSNLNQTTVYQGKSGATNSNNGSMKRKPSNQSSTSNVMMIPVLNMKKMSARQIQSNQVKQKSFSKRDLGDAQNQSQINKMMNESMAIQGSNQLSSIQDSALYKNLTQKLIQQQQQLQQQSQEFSNSNGQVMNTTLGKATISPTTANQIQIQFQQQKQGQAQVKGFGSLVSTKKQATPKQQSGNQRFFSNQKNTLPTSSNLNGYQVNQANQMSSYQSAISPNQIIHNYTIAPGMPSSDKTGGQLMSYMYGAPQQHDQRIPITSNNKNKKSFVFDFTGDELNLKGKKSVNQSSSGQATTKANAKKKLNLTQTIPKGLLSPTNNSNKPKHSNYFDDGQKREEEVQLSYLDDFNKEILNQMNQIEYKPSQIQGSGQPMLVKMPTDYQGLMLNQMTFHNTGTSSQGGNPSTQELQMFMSNNNDQITGMANNLNFGNEIYATETNKLNQTAKIKRNDSLSPISDAGIQGFHQIIAKPSMQKSQLISNIQANQLHQQQLQLQQMQLLNQINQVQQQQLMSKANLQKLQAQQNQSAVTINLQNLREHSSSTENQQIISHISQVNPIQLLKQQQQQQLQQLIIQGQINNYSQEQLQQLIKERQLFNQLQLQNFQQNLQSQQQAQFNYSSSQGQEDIDEGEEKQEEDKEVENVNGEDCENQDEVNASDSGGGASALIRAMASATDTLTYQQPAECYEDKSNYDFKSLKVLSTGQTPRVFKQKKSSLGDIPNQKTENITIRKKIVANHQIMTAQAEKQSAPAFSAGRHKSQPSKTHIRKKISIQLDLSGDEEDHYGMQAEKINSSSQQIQDQSKTQIRKIPQVRENFKLKTQNLTGINKIISESDETQAKAFAPKRQKSIPNSGNNTSPLSANQPANIFVAKQPLPQLSTSTQSKPIHGRKQSVHSHSSKTTSPRLSPQVHRKLLLQQQIQQEIQNLKFPISAPKAIKYFSNYLSDYEKGEILDYKQVYFVGQNAKKIKGSPHQPHNSGYDDERGDYKVVLQDHIGYRWEVLEFLGKGSFGQAIKCFDHKTQEIVAIKLIRNKKRFQHQAGVELKILQHLKYNDPEDQYNIIRIKDYLVFRKHLVISFELFSINLYEFIKNNNFQGVSLSLIRRFAIQILQALKFLKEERVIHCDLKPENILLKFPDKSGIKVIDFGSSCFEDERIYTYIQSRFYRAPEIVLGIPYTQAIDMWSFGCILVELFLGYPIFPGESEQEQLGLIMEVRDVPSNIVLNQATRRKLFFDENNDPILVENSKGRVRIPGNKSLASMLRCSSPSFIDFIERCLDWDPKSRITPIEALMHEWIIEGLPPKVLQHHQKILGLIPADFNQNDSIIEEAEFPQSSSNTRYQSQPPLLKKDQSQGSKLNKTCLISEEFTVKGCKQRGGLLLEDGVKGSKRGKSLNKTGLVVIDENEDIADVNDIDNFYFLNQKQKAQKQYHGDKQQRQPQHIIQQSNEGLITGGLDMEDYEDENDEVSFEQVEKSKTTNLTDLLYQIKKSGKQQNYDKINIQNLNENSEENSYQIDCSKSASGVGNKPHKNFENTHDIGRLKKASFFSQSKRKLFNSQLDIDDLEDQKYQNEGELEEEDEEAEGIFLPYDEREHRDNAQGGQGVQNVTKKNKIPFSFLMHHYMKNNQGSQPQKYQAALDNGQNQLNAQDLHHQQNMLITYHQNIEGMRQIPQLVVQNQNGIAFYKPRGKDIKLNNYIGAVGGSPSNSGASNIQAKIAMKKGFVNLSSNV